jgi:hypothetical protein
MNYANGAPPKLREANLMFARRRALSSTVIPKSVPRIGFTGRGPVWRLARAVNEWKPKRSLQSLSRRSAHRDLIRGGHYGQRSCEPHSKAEHMAAPTNAALVKKALANSEPSTHGPFRRLPRRPRCPVLGKADFEADIANRSFVTRSGCRAAAIAVMHNAPTQMW